MVFLTQNIKHIRKLYIPSRKTFDLNIKELDKSLPILRHQ